MKKEEDANRLADRALPCPFCGERLVVANDHHGYWLQHKDHLSSPCHENVAQVSCEDDLARWNTRVKTE